MEVDERPTETYTDIGGLDKQIEELVEAMWVPSFRLVVADFH
jgi:26S proteasome regulatory subunit T5